MPDDDNDDYEADDEDEESAEDYEDKADLETKLAHMEKMMGKLTKVVEKQNNRISELQKEDPPEDEQEDADRVGGEPDGEPGTDEDVEPDEGALEEQDLPDEPQEDAMTAKNVASGSTPRPKGGNDAYGLADSGRTLQKAKQDGDIKALVKKTLEAEHEHSGRAANEDGPFRQPTRESKRKTELWIRKNIRDAGQPVSLSEDLSGGSFGVGNINKAV